MRQFTTPQQTTKLIELGFEKPKCATMFWRDEKEVTEINYTMGELLSFCPEVISNDKFGYATINIFHDTINWVVGYDDVDGIMRFGTSDIELIDALCTMCRKLKEEGVI